MRFGVLWLFCEVFCVIFLRLSSHLQGLAVVRFSCSSPLFTLVLPHTLCFQYKFFKNMSNKQQQNNNTLDFSIYKYYEDNHKKNRVLDIGFGSGDETIYYAQKGYKVLAIDLDEKLKTNLLNKITSKNQQNQLDESLKSNIEFGIGDCLEMDFGSEQFSVILLNNLIHFFDEKECDILFNKILKILEVGGVCYVLAHHKNHPQHYSQYEDLKQNQHSHFRQFFDKDSLLTYIRNGIENKTNGTKNTNERQYKILRYEYIENCYSESVHNKIKNARPDKGLNYKPIERENDECQIRLVFQKL